VVNTHGEAGWGSGSSGLAAVSLSQRGLKLSWGLVCAGKKSEVGKNCKQKHELILNTLQQWRSHDFSMRRIWAEGRAPSAGRFLQIFKK